MNPVGYYSNEYANINTELLNRWQKMQYLLHLSLPNYAENSLRFRNLEFNNPDLFSQITDITMDELYEFITKPLFLGETTDHEKNYHRDVYHNQPENSQFTIEERQSTQTSVGSTNSMHPTDSNTTRSSLGESSKTNSLKSDENCTMPGNENFTIEAEKEHLIRFIHGCVQRHLKTLDVHSQRLLQDKRSIKIIVMGNKADSGEILYKAKVSCPLCNAVIQLKKNRPNQNKRYYWRSESFLTHFLTHMRLTRSNDEVDLDIEKRKIISMVNNFASKYADTLKIHFQRLLQDRTDIVVTRINTNIGIQYVAKIPCPLCNKILSITRKYHAFKRPRLNIWSFIRHIQIMHDDKIESN